MMVTIEVGKAIITDLSAAAEVAGSTSEKRASQATSLEDGRFLTRLAGEVLMVSWT